MAALRSGLVVTPTVAAGVQGGFETRPYSLGAARNACGTGRGARAYTDQVSELPDISVCIDGLGARVQGQVLRQVRLVNAFVLRMALSRLLKVSWPKTVDDL